MSEEAGSFARSGGVQERDGRFRAHVQYRGEQGRKADLHGPRRPEASEAESDLASMRAAAAVFPDDRVRAFQSMHAEARRLQERAKYAREIEAITLRRTLTDSDYEEAEEECLQMEDDADEWWRDLQDGKQKEEKTEEKPPTPVHTPTEATEVLLNTFRPIRESVGELRRLLDLKADPNAPVPAGLISPLQHVVLFAPVRNVVAMRDLLLQRGAVETEDDTKRWAIRQDSDRFEPARVRDFYEDDRHLSPWAATMDM